MGLEFIIPFPFSLRRDIFLVFLLVLVDDLTDFLEIWSLFVLNCPSLLQACQMLNLTEFHENYPIHLLFQTLIDVSIDLCVDPLKKLIHKSTEMNLREKFLWNLLPVLFNFRSSVSPIIVNSRSSLRQRNMLIIRLGWLFRPNESIASRVIVLHKCKSSHILRSVYGVFCQWGIMPSIIHWILVVDVSDVVFCISDESIGFLLASTHAMDCWVFLIETVHKSEDLFRTHSAIVVDG